MKKNNIFLLSLSLFFCTFLQSSELPQISIPLEKPTPLKIEHPPFEHGSLTVICGSMCCGKSAEFIRQVGRFILAGFEILVFKPSIDNRKILELDQDPSTYIPSRNGSWVNCTPVSSVEDMETIIDASPANVIAIEEIHFFTPEKDALVALIKKLLEQNKKIITAGLELDFRREPFGPMPDLLALADQVMKLTSICSVCGNDTYCISQRLVNGEPAHYNDPLIMVGAANLYEPRCRKCHIVRKD